MGNEWLLSRVIYLVLPLLLLLSRVLVLVRVCPAVNDSSSRSSAAAVNREAF